MEVIIEDVYRRTSPSWVSFLKGFDSAKQYVKQVEMFLDYPETNASMHESLNEYFDHMHEQVSILKKDEGKNKPRFASTTMRSIFAMLKKFFLHTGRAAIWKQSILSKWDKHHVVKQAMYFTQEDLG
jgi:hypothetical protein